MAVTKYLNGEYKLPTNEESECNRYDHRFICDGLSNTRGSRGTCNCPRGRDEQYCDYLVGKFKIFYVIGLYIKDLQWRLANTATFK